VCFAWVWFESGSLRERLKKPVRKHRFFCAQSADEARFNPLIESKKAAALKAAQLFQSFKPHPLGITSAPGASNPQSTPSRPSNRYQTATPDPKGLQLKKFGRPELVYLQMAE
jgi:hypothetical protein